jgi:hypothetical protein
MATKARNWFITIFILTLPFALFFGFLIAELSKPLVPIQPLPNPNGYDDFVKAGQVISTNEDDYYKTNEADLRKLVEKNANGVSLAREGMSKECRVTVQFNSAYANNHISDLISVKELARTFSAEGQIAEMENHPSDAAKSYLDAFHLGTESARGGVLIDQLVGTAIEAIATRDLTNLIDRLDAKSCRETAATLETFDSQKQSWDDVVRQENTWSRRTFTGLRYRLSLLVSGQTLRQSQLSAKLKFEKQQIKTRQLIIDFAERAYELDKGHPPASLADLMPDYLKAIPQDPLTGTNIVYSPR